VRESAPFSFAAHTYAHLNVGVILSRPQDGEGSQPEHSLNRNQRTHPVPEVSMAL